MPNRQAGLSTLQKAKDAFRVNGAVCGSESIGCKAGQEKAIIAGRTTAMQRSTLLFHHGSYQKLWQQAGLIQVGPHVADGPDSLRLTDLSVAGLQTVLRRRGWAVQGVLLQYTDPFLLRSAPLRGINQWAGPRILACGDLHHGPNPIATLQRYCSTEQHHAVLLTFNPIMLETVQQYLSIPVRSLAPTFFRYPTTTPSPTPEMKLLHVGSLGNHHPQRRQIVEALMRRQKIPFCHATTASPEEAAQLYAKHALILNIPLNRDLNHRVFEIMAAGVPQVIFGDPSLLGRNSKMANRPDLFWTQSIEELEKLVMELVSKKDILQAIPVHKPPYWDLKELLKQALSP